MLVLNDETAEILVGEEMPHEVRVDEAIEGKLTNVTSVNYKDIGMRVRVKPTVLSENNSIYLDIFIENSVVATPNIIRTATGNDNGNNQVISSFNYTIKTSRSKNCVLLHSGQTTMIGGLITNVKVSDNTGIPFLKDIPLLGWLFKSSHKIDKAEQLMIFITPTLV